MGPAEPPQRHGLAATSTNANAASAVSYKGPAPLLDEASRRDLYHEHAARQPVNPKPSNDGDILGIGGISGTWTREEREKVDKLQKDILHIVKAIGCDVNQFSKEVIAARTVSDI